MSTVFVLWWLPVCMVTKQWEVANNNDVSSSLPVSTGSINLRYWPTKRSRWLNIHQVLFFASLWIKMESRSIHIQKKWSQYPGYPGSIKDLVYTCRIKNNFFLCTILRGQDSTILPAKVANHNAWLSSFCPQQAIHTIRKQY